MEEKTELAIEGMSCEACVAHVTRALQSVSKVTRAEVSLKAKSATVYHDGADPEAMRDAVEEEGYSAVLKKN